MTYIITNNDILLFIEKNKNYIYYLHNKKEVILEENNSSFFEKGEIKNVKEYYNFIEQKVYSSNLFLKSNLHILYNDIASCDLIYLYKEPVQNLFNNIYMYPISKIIKEISNSHIIYFDGESYNDFIKKTKTLEHNFNEKNIYIGTNELNNLHYSNKQILWEKFKSHFTKK